MRPIDEFPRFTRTGAVAIVYCAVTALIAADEPGDQFVPLFPPEGALQRLGNTKMG